MIVIQETTIMMHISAEGAGSGGRSLAPTILLLHLVEAGRDVIRILHGKEFDAILF